MSQEGERMNSPLTFEPWAGQTAMMTCPSCGFNCTHIEGVWMVARPEGEDGPLVPIHVDASGIIVNGELSEVPHEGTFGRRHTIVLTGYCENGCRFSISFQQHKGSTLVGTHGERCAERD